MHVVFKILAAHSHLNATFKLASALLSNGYQVTYSGNREFQKDVIVKGFNYFIDTDLPIPVPSNKRVNFFKRISYKKILTRKHREYAKGMMFEKIIEVLGPDLIVVDSPFVRDSICILRKDIPFVIFESMVALSHAPLHPPLCSQIIPQNTFFNKVAVHFAWKKYYLNTFVNQQLFGAGFPSKYWIKKLAAKTNFPVEHIDFQRYFHIGLNNVPEIIASPLEFDFPREKKANQYYLGVSVKEDRQEASFDLKFNQARLLIEKTISQNKLCKQNERVALIYCSFGSMAWRYDGVSEFYQMLIEAYNSEKNVEIFISVGYETKWHLFKDLPKHIHVFKKVPQIELLKKMDLMITHGGMNTITECIISEVPMLVYPGFNQIDQVGNACRVEFHHIGLKGDLKKERAKHLKEKVTTVLKDKRFKQNIINMKQKMLCNDNTNEILNLFAHLLRHRTSPECKLADISKGDKLPAIADASF